MAGEFDILRREIEALRGQVTELQSEKAVENRKRRYELDVISARDAWQDSRADNVDTGFPMRLRLYIPEGADTRLIKRVLLNVWLDAFRSYGTGAASTNLGTVSISANTTANASATTTGPSATTTTSQSSATTTGPSATTTTSQSSATTTGPSATTTTSQSSSTTTSETAHYHADEYGTTTVDGSVGLHSHYVPIHNTYNSGAHSHTFTHTHEIPSHTHTLSHTHEIPSHTHTLSHTHEIPSHTHDLSHVHDMSHTHTLGSHTHALIHGIYLGTVASGCTILVNTVDVTNALIGAATFGTDQTSLDITQYINKGLNTIDITSLTLGRIDAMVFANVYLNK